MLKHIIIFFYFLITLPSFGQRCEVYDRKLFNMLPGRFPDTINCIDSKGKKQGDWIHYEVSYNPVDRPNELEKGNYVDEYSFGSYTNNQKIGEWKTIANVHQIYVRRTDNYSLKRDTTIIMSQYLKRGWTEAKFSHTADGSFFRYEVITYERQFPIIISCNDKTSKKQCIISYRGTVIKTFPFGELSYEMEGLDFNYIRQINWAEEKIKNGGQ